MLLVLVRCILVVLILGIQPVSMKCIAGIHSNKENMHIIKFSKEKLFVPNLEKFSHCRFKHKPQLPWSAIAMSVGVAVIVLLVGHIFHAALNRIEEVEDDYRKMRELKVRAEAADVAKSQVFYSLYLNNIWYMNQM